MGRDRTLYFYLSSLEKGKDIIELHCDLIKTLEVTYFIKQMNQEMPLHFTLFWGNMVLPVYPPVFPQGFLYFRTVLVKEVHLSCNIHKADYLLSLVIGTGPFLRSLTFIVAIENSDPLPL